MIGKKMRWIQHTLFLKEVMNYYYQLSIKKERLKKKKVFEKVLKKEYHTVDELDESLLKIKRYLNPDLIRKHFNHNTLGEMLTSFNNAKGTYKTK